MRARKTTFSDTAVGHFPMEGETFLARFLKIFPIPRRILREASPICSICGCPIIPPLWTQIAFYAISLFGAVVFPLVVIALRKLGWVELLSLLVIGLTASILVDQVLPSVLLSVVSWKIDDGTITLGKRLYERCAKPSFYYPFSFLRILLSLHMLSRMVHYFQTGVWH